MYDMNVNNKNILILTLYLQIKRSKKYHYQVISQHSTLHSPQKISLYQYHKSTTKVKNTIF